MTRPFFARSRQRARTAAAVLAFAALLLPALAAPGGAAAQILSDDAPARGQAVRLTQPVDTLLVTYRPSSSIAHTDTLFGAQAWTPTEAGVVNLATPDGNTSQNASVRFEKTPLPGLGVLLAAGLILFGGATYAFRKLFEDDAPAPT